MIPASDPDALALCRFISAPMSDEDRFYEALYICALFLLVPPREPWWQCGQETYTCQMGIQHIGRN